MHFATYPVLSVNAGTVRYRELLGAMTFGRAAFVAFGGVTASALVDDCGEDRQQQCDRSE